MRDILGKSIILGTIIIHIFAAAACTYTQRIQDGRMAFERKQYSVAIPMLKKEYRKAKSRIEKGQLAFLIGESYKNRLKSPEAIEWYQIAYDYQYGVEALEEMAYALKKSERYQEAISAFKNLGIEIGSPYEYRREIEACQTALRWTNEEQQEYTVELLDFNSNFSDYSPTLYKDNQLVFTSDRTTATGEETYNWTGNNFYDIFVVDLVSKNAQPFDNQINTPFNEGTTAFNQNYSEVYFSRCGENKKEGDDYCKLMVSQVNGSSWSQAEVLPFVKEGINYGSPALSDDGNTLYFSAEDPEGWGGKDIWVVERTPEGGWGLPSLMSRSINTPGDEMFPFVDADTLYFSSDQHQSMGGLDIYKSYKLNGRWTPAQNLKTPINSGADDFGYVVDYDAPEESEDILQVGYFTSNRESGQGYDDIYRFIKTVPPPPPPADPDEEKEPIVYKIKLDGYVLEKIYQEPGNPDSKVLGRKPLPGSEVTATFGTGKTERFTVGEDGRFSMELDYDTDYYFFASAEGYLNNETTFSTKGIAKDPDNPVQEFEVEVELDKIYLNREIVLENIYYDFDKWDIRADARPTLDELTENLKLNPDIRIELASHTDCRGNDRYNEELSQRRAQSAVDYLIANGIDASRLEAKGYGETNLRIECVCSRCTEEEHQMNRRTTFKIIE